MITLLVMQEDTTSLSWKVIATLAVMMAVVYGHTLAGDFVWDDVFLIERNANLRDFSSMWTTAWADFFQQGHSTSSGYLRPVPTILNWLTVSIFGPSPFVFHLVNLCLHLTTLILAGRLLVRLGLSGLGTAVALGVFTLHPMQVEALSFVSCRPELCAGLAVFAVLTCYQRYRQAGSFRWLLLACIALALGLLSKIIVLSVIPIILWFENGQSAKRHWGAASLLALMGILFLTLRLLWGPTLTEGIQYEGPRILVALNLLGFYIGQLMCLEGPRCLYTYLELTHFGLYFWMGLISCLALVIPILRRQFSGPKYLVILWFLAFLVPVLHLIPFGTVAADRYLYLPMWGIGLGCGLLVDRVLADGPVTRRLLLVVLSVTAVVMGTVSVKRAYQWRTELALWSAEISQLPVQGHALTEYGTALGDAGRLSEAQHVYWAAWALKPGNSILFRNLLRLEARTLPPAMRHGLLTVGLDKSLDRKALKVWIGPLKAVQAYPLVDLITRYIQVIED